MKVNIVIEKDDYGYYAFCPEMKGCQSQGDSLDEVLSNIKEAVELYFETLSSEEKKSLPKQRNFNNFFRDFGCLNLQD